MYDQTKTKLVRTILSLQFSLDYFLQFKIMHIERILSYVFVACIFYVIVLIILIFQINFSHNFFFLMLLQRNQKDLKKYILSDNVQYLCCTIVLYRTSFEPVSTVIGTMKRFIISEFSPRWYQVRYVRYDRKYKRYESIYGGKYSQQSQHLQENGHKIVY